MKLKAQENHQYNIWIEEATRDPRKTVILFGKEKTVKSARVFVDLMLGGALLLLMVSFFVVKWSQGITGSWGIVLSVVRLLLFVLFLVASGIEIYAGNQLKKLFKKEQEQGSSTAVLENDEMQSEIRNKMKQEYMESSSKGALRGDTRRRFR